MRVGLNPKRLAIPPHFFQNRSHNHPLKTQSTFNTAGEFFCTCNLWANFFFYTKSQLCGGKVGGCKGGLIPNVASWWVFAWYFLTTQ